MKKEKNSIFLLVVFVVVASGLMTLFDRGSKKVGDAKQANSISNEYGMKPIEEADYGMKSIEEADKNIEIMKVSAKKYEKLNSALLSGLILYDDSSKSEDAKEKMIMRKILDISESANLQIFCNGGYAKNKWLPNSLMREVLSQSRNSEKFQIIFDLYKKSKDASSLEDFILQLKEKIYTDTGIEGNPCEYIIKSQEES